MTSWPRAARWAVYIAIAALFAVVCAFLSSWQFDRNDSRAATNALIENNYDATPLPITEAIEGTDGFDPADEWLPVILEGEYLPDDQMLVRNRAQGGTAAYEVIVPFRIDDGRVFVVSRGWIPPDFEEGHQAVPAPPEGEATVIARLRPSEPLPGSHRSAPDGQLATLHVPSVAEATGDTTITTAYGILVSEDPAPAVAPSPLAEPEVDPGPHLSYAIQWILFAIMGFVFIGYMIRTEITAAREPEPDDEDDDELEGFIAEKKPPRKPRARRTRKRDADMEAEDALLDA